MKTILFVTVGALLLFMAVAVFQYEPDKTQDPNHRNHRLHDNIARADHSLLGNFNSTESSANEWNLSQTAAVKTGAKSEHVMLGDDYLEQELAGIDDAIESIRIFASYAGDASPDDYAKLHELEKKRWAALKRTMGKERYLQYFYHESNAGRIVSKTLSPMLVPEKEQIQILAKATHDGEVDEIDQDVLFDQISGTTKLEGNSTADIEFMGATPADADTDTELD